jgi:nitroimidazol reductase NimA-like FMN-containing flavoprotein (pyridoxamine 5'-phosphate oxidase superfamily)
MSVVPVRVLSRLESRALLRGGGAGHLGLSVRALPVVVPVTFAVDDDAVTVWGGALDRLPVLHVGDVVAFQADGLDSDGSWSVLVRGRAEMTSSAGGALRISAELVDGQRF